jgi:hypothetical protein
MPLTASFAGTADGYFSDLNWYRGSGIRFENVSAKFREQVPPRFAPTDSEGIGGYQPLSGKLHQMFPTDAQEFSSPASIYEGFDLRLENCPE